MRAIRRITDRALERLSPRFGTLYINFGRPSIPPEKREDGLRARARKRFRSTTMGEHDQPVAANVIAQQFTADRPNQRWAGDTTELVIGTSGKLYLAAILDLYSRFVVGWALSAVNDRHLALRALEMALKRRCPEAGVAAPLGSGLHLCERRLSGTASPVKRGPLHVAQSALVAPPAVVIVGVDTHKHIHVAVAIDALGVRLATLSASADRTGYAALVAWARSLGTVQAFGIEGTGSYGVGLASHVRRHAIRVVEVSHCDRRKRRNNGKSDTLDAETAARSVLAGIATAVPKTADGSAEMVRQIKVARDTAVKAKSAAIITLKTLIVNAPDDLREVLEPLTDRKLIDRCARLLPGAVVNTVAPTNHALRAIAGRWLTLSSEIDTHDEALDLITQAAAPTLREAFGIGPDSAAEMMIVAGDNPTRVRSEAAFAKLCGACPIPASSGVTNRHRLFRGGHRQANAALYRIVTVRMRWHQPTMGLRHQTYGQGLSKKDIIRCLKRFVAREIFRALLDDHRFRQSVNAAA